MTGRTTIVITHDLDLAPDADRILVLEHGRIAESGSHRQLLAAQGAYATLHRSHTSAPRLLPTMSSTDAALAPKAMSTSTPPRGQG
jgi:ATP-binding cassette subfamily B protein